MKISTLQRELFVSNGMTHMGYRAERLEDLISSYSMPGSEVLSGEFLAQVNDMMAYIPKKLPVVMEISGAEFTPREQELIRETVRENFLLRLAAERQRTRRLLLKALWLLVSTVLSTILLYLGQNAEFALSQLAYLPFWFFGYRLLTCMVLDLLPQLKKEELSGRIAVMKLFFSGCRPVNEVTEEKRAALLREIEATPVDRPGPEHIRRIRQRHLTDEEGHICIRARVRGTEDILSRSGVAGYELLNDGLREYIFRAAAYLPRKAKLRVTICGPRLTPQERTAAETAMHTAFALKEEENRNAMADSRMRICSFTALAILCLVLMSLGETLTLKGLREFITMMFWFFADYLVEYVLIEYTGLLAERVRCRALRTAEIGFAEETH